MPLVPEMKMRPDLGTDPAVPPYTQAQQIFAKVSQYQSVVIHVSEKTLSPEDPFHDLHDGEGCNSPHTTLFLLHWPLKTRG